MCTSNEIILFINNYGKSVSLNFLNNKKIEIEYS